MDIWTSLFLTYLIYPNLPIDPLGQTPTIPTVTITILAWKLFCYEKLGRTDGRTDG